MPSRARPRSRPSIQGTAAALLAVLLLWAGPASAQDGSTEPVAPVPEVEDPLVNEGASEELDPNTPVDPDQPAPDPDAVPTEGECELV
ncbi:MAG: hypothetical protein HKN24_12230, partial [Acidimicrobiales bacterium]|nr:hypothetical protein [Acidimicrobiales bacterium]